MKVLFCWVMGFVVDSMGLVVDIKGFVVDIMGFVVYLFAIIEEPRASLLIV